MKFVIGLLTKIVVTWGGVDMAMEIEAYRKVDAG